MAFYIPGDRWRAYDSAADIALIVGCCAGADHGRPAGADGSPQRMPSAVPMARAPARRAFTMSASVAG